MSYNSSSYRSGDWVNLNHVIILLTLLYPPPVISNNCLCINTLIPCAKIRPLRASQTFPLLLTYTAKTLAPTPLLYYCQNCFTVPHGLPDSHQSFFINSLVLSSFKTTFFLSNSYHHVALYYLSMASWSVQWSMNFL